MWTSLVGDGSIPDPTSKADEEVLVQVVNELLVEYAQRTKALAERRRSQATLWQAAHEYWQRWLEDRANPMQPELLPSLAPVSHGSSADAWLDAAGILAEKDREEAMRMVTSAVLEESMSLPSTAASPSPPAVTTLLAAVTKRLERVRVDHCGSTAIKERWEMLEQQLRIETGRLHFKRQCMDLQSRSVNSTDSMSTEEEEEAAETEPIASPTVRLGGRVAKGRARMQLLEQQPAARKRPRRFGYLSKHAPRLVDLVMKATNGVLTSNEEDHFVEECITFFTQADKAEATLIGAGRWLSSDDAQSPKRQRMLELREESRPLVDAAKELKSNLAVLHLSEPARLRLNMFF